MSNVITHQRFWQRRDTVANWTLYNPVLASGEIGVELGTPQLFKIGDGVTAWNSLRYSGAPYGAIGCTFDGGGSVLQIGSACDIRVPFNCRIVKASVLADQSGSIEISVWADTLANYPPTAADNICASAPPSITASDKNEDSTLTGWTTSLTAGQTVRFTVANVASIERATIILDVIKS